MEAEFGHILDLSSDPLVSKLTSFGRRVVPQRFRAGIRDILFGPPNIPFDKPYFLNSSVRAMYYIRNRSDYYRIVGDGVEIDYRLEMEEVFSQEGESGKFLDIGCAQGLYSILAAKHGLLVDAFDPDPVSLVSLRANIKLNSLFNKVKVYSIALADYTGRTGFFIDRSGSLAPSIVQTVSGLKEKIEVPVNTVDCLIRQGKLFNPTVVKIDVEGAEGKVLKGMEKLLESSVKPKNLFIELHRDYLPSFGDDIYEVGRSVLGYGYRVNWSIKCPSGLLCHFVC